MFVRTLGACAVLAVAASAFAAAAETKPLRTLTFTINYSAVSSITSTMAGGLEVGSGFESHGFANDDKGTMRVDVIAATADGGLVVDASFTGDKTRQIPVRIAILSDGRLAFDPKLNVAPELIEFLPLLARGLLADQAPATGSTWTAPAPQPLEGTRTYHVTTATDTSASLSITTDARVGGGQGYDRHEESSLVYDRKLSRPVRYDTRIRLRRRGLNGPETTDLHLTAALAGDTFGPLGS
ncbi:MAG TPA: hypothetical protein VGD01_17515 [Candidatus Elarobacter sp.]|jgi:hypothetical protein